MVAHDPWLEYDYPGIIPVREKTRLEQAHDERFEDKNIFQPRNHDAPVDVLAATLELIMQRTRAGAEAQRRERAEAEQQVRALREAEQAKELAAQEAVRESRQLRVAGISDADACTPEEDMYYSEF